MSRPLTDSERTQCATLSALLQAAGLVAGWGLALSVIAAAVLALTMRSLSITATMGFGAVVVLGVLERYFAFRLRLDRHLFDALVNGTIDSLRALDGALAGLGLRTAPAEERALDQRLQGTRQLMQRQLIVVACQTAMFLLAVMTEDLR
jgi:hypothetical protein